MSDWTQHDVGLARADGSALPSARRLFAELSPRLDAFRAGGGLSCFFFVRKPPDVRLRFAGLGTTEAQDLAATLADLKRTGVLTSCQTSVYEPETRKHGGPEAMALAHRYFDTDTHCWMQLDRLRAQGAADLNAQRLCTAVIDDMFLRALADPTEVWDAWCNYADLVGDVASTDGAETASSDAPERLDTVHGQAQAGERPVIEAYADANQALAEGLVAVQRAGKLDAGLRALLPFIAMLHAHRHGLGPAQHAAMARTMAALRDPRRGLRGARS